MIEIKNAHVFLFFFKTICPSLLLSSVSLKQTLCQWLTELYTTSKHHWSANWGGGDMVVLQCLLSAEGRENMLQCCDCLHHSVYVHPPFPPPHLSIYILFISVFRVSSSPASCEDETGNLPPPPLEISVQSQANKDLNYHCSPAF